MAAHPDGWAAVEGTSLVARDGFVQLCAEVQGEECVDGAIVRGAVSYTHLTLPTN